VPLAGSGGLGNSYDRFVRLFTPAYPL